MAATIQQMGGPAVPGSIYRLTVYTYLAPQMAMTNLNLVLASVTGPNTTLLGTICLAMHNTYNTAWKAAIATAASLTGSKLAPQFPKPLSIPGIVTEGAAGSGGSNPLPQQVSGLQSLRTMTQGRAYRGRLYYPFPWAAAMDTDYTPTAAYVTLINSLSAVFVSLPYTIVSGADTFVFRPVIYHRKAGKTGVPAANTYDIIQGGTTRKLWATQRKRGDYGRTNPNSIS